MLQHDDAAPPRMSHEGPIEQNSSAMALWHSDCAPRLRLTILISQPVYQLHVNKRGGLQNRAQKPNAHMPRCKYIWITDYDQQNEPCEV